MSFVVTHEEIAESDPLVDVLPKGCRQLTHCVVCGGSDLKPYLDLGRQPLANAFSVTPLPIRYPLGLNVCRSCWHSQLQCIVDPEIMFRDYAYVSGTSSSLRNYFTSFVERVERDFNAETGKRRLAICEAGSNDGTLLSLFAKRGHDVLGVDPATNLMHAAKENGVPTINTFFDANVALPVKFDVIIMMNVLAHTATPLEMLQTAKRYLAPGGRIYVQTSQAKMLERVEFDTVYHEHVSFFSARSFFQLARRIRLFVKNISYVDVHGTSYLVELTDENTGEFLGYDPNEMMLNEQLRGYYADALYDQFQYRASLTAEHAISTIAECKRLGWRIAGYGAAAKATVFMNATGLRPDFVIDDNPLKLGKLVPGTNVHVTSREALMQPGKTLFVIFAWNMKDEIIARIKQERHALLRPETSDAFLVYFPAVELTQ